MKEYPFRRVQEVREESPAESYDLNPERSILAG